MFKKGKKPEYKSPISVNCTNKERVYYVEEKIMDEVRIKLHVDVNKEELLKALAYDRNQYEKGYNDAKAIYGKALDKACKFIDEFTQTCPNDMFDCEKLKFRNDILFCIGETLVDESKMNITTKCAIKRIREYMCRLNDEGKCIKENDIYDR